MTELWNDGCYDAAVRLGLKQYFADMVVSESTFYSSDQTWGAASLGMRVGMLVYHMKAARAEVFCDVFEKEILRTEPPEPMEYQSRNRA
jgi:hypothetical protein